jgi:hypothetical protein
LGQSDPELQTRLIQTYLTLVKQSDTIPDVKVIILYMHPTFEIQRPLNYNRGVHDFVQARTAVIKKMGAKMGSSRQPAQTILDFGFYTILAWILKLCSSRAPGNSSLSGQDG